MLRYRRCLFLGTMGSLAIVVSGCSSGGAAKDNAALLEEARGVTATALGELLMDWPGTVEDVGVRNGVPVVQSHAPEGTEGVYCGV